MVHGITPIYDCDSFAAATWAWYSLYSLYLALEPRTRSAGYLAAFLASLLLMAVGRSTPHLSASLNATQRDARDV